jgi:uncharacterized protein
MLSQAEGYWPVLQRLIELSKATGPSIHDARIAALCIHHGVRTSRDSRTFERETPWSPTSGIYMAAPPAKPLNGRR